MKKLHFSIIVLFSLFLIACGQTNQAISPTSAMPTAPAKIETSSVQENLVQEGQSHTVSGPYTLSEQHANLFGQLGLTPENIAYLGDPNAPIVMIEFADYGCPYCVRHHQETFPEIKARYIDTGKVFYMFKDLPIITKQGPNIAQATFCAAEQGNYWDMHDAMFDRSPDWKASDEASVETYRSAASDLGLDPDALETCVKSEKYASAVLEDREQGINLGLRGTPGFLINGVVLTGAHPMSTFIEILDEQLGTSSSPNS
jgi:protein-disulfide isomerase